MSAQEEHDSLRAKRSVAQKMKLGGIYRRVERRIATLYLTLLVDWRSAARLRFYASGKPAVGECLTDAGQCLDEYRPG